MVRGTVPDNAVGNPPILGYDVRYKEVSGASWTEKLVAATTHPFDPIALFDALTAGTAYEFQVRAYNNDNNEHSGGPWSDSVCWSTDGQSTCPTASTNSAPTFGDGASTTRAVDENRAGGVNVGTAVAAPDDDSGDTLTYSLSGTDAASFGLVTTSGQLQTKAAASYDYETKSSYEVTVSVTDSKDSSGSADSAVDDTITVTISLNDVDEVLDPPATVELTGNGDAQLTVEWTAPPFNGGSAMTGYTVQWKTGGGAFAEYSAGASDTSYTITGLTPG